MIIYRKAVKKDIQAVAAVYDSVHDAEERGEMIIGWERGVYPVTSTAEAAFERDDLYVCLDDEIIVATAIINQIQVDCYAAAEWTYDALPGEVLVLHTLAVRPDTGGRGVGTGFVRYYEDMACKLNTPYLRMDTNEKNLRARSMYKQLGYSEIAIVPTTFNGIAGVNLVLLEKKL